MKTPDAVGADAVRAYRPHVERGQGEGEGSAAPQGQSAPVDRATISTQGEQRWAIHEASKESPETRPEVVAYFRKLVQEGRYLDEESDIGRLAVRLLAALA